MLIEGPDARHLAVVRRAKQGDRIEVADGKGRVLQAAVDSVSAEGVRATVVSERSTPRPDPAVTVLQGLARESKVDVALQKLAELGVDRVLIFAVSRSVPRWSPAKRIDIRRRWEKICYEASKQSRRAWLPHVDGPADLPEALRAASEHDLCLVADPLAERTLRNALPSRKPSSVAVVVGPEGGLDRDEVRRFCEHGGLPVSIGEQILRTETAGLAIASVLMYHFGRFG